MITRKRILLVFITIIVVALCFLALSFSRTTTKLTTTPIFVTPTVESVLNPSPDRVNTFTGNVSYNGYDKNGDGFFDYLRIDAEIEVNQADQFGAWSSLMLPNGDMLNWGGLMPIHYDAPAGVVSLKEGIQNVSIYFDGNAIRHSGIDGPYKVTITLFGEESLTSDTIHFITDTLNRRDFWYKDSARCDYAIQAFCRLRY